MCEDLRKKIAGENTEDLVKYNRIPENYKEKFYSAFHQALSEFSSKEIIEWSKTLKNRLFGLKQWEDRPFFP